MLLFLSFIFIPIVCISFISIVCQVLCHLLGRGVLSARGKHLILKSRSLT